MTSGVGEDLIGIISPYSAQIRLLRQNIHPRFPSIEIETVDGFQGREKEVIVTSLVRSNSGGGIGFLAESKRLNVAITRARRQVVIVCDSGTVCRDSFIRDLVTYVMRNGLVVKLNRAESTSSDFYASAIGHDPSELIEEMQVGVMTSSTRD